MIATCLGAAVGSILCAVLSNQPYAMAPGMGLNTFFAFTLCSPAMYGYTWQQALALTFLAGCLFLLITLSPLRERILSAVPENLQHAIAAGIGLFIALIVVGMYLLMEIRKVDFTRADDALPAFLTILLIPLTYSITTGIGAGLVAWAICKAAGRRSELNGAAAALALVFLLYLCF